MPDRAKRRAQRARFLPYGRQEIGDADIKAVVEALVSGWLTTGPRVGAIRTGFRAAIAAPREGVAVNSGTAALHCRHARDRRGPGDEVIVPAITFAASANAALYEGATPVFADVEPDTLLIDPASVATTITPTTRAIVAVDYAGQPADYDALRALGAKRGIRMIADACHAPGATYKGRKAGTLADISCFSFHPVKHLTTCEGGMCATDDAEMAAHMRRFRNHGIDSDHRTREAEGAYAYDMAELGYNYRLPDVQCALGMAQLQRLPAGSRRGRRSRPGMTDALPGMPAGGAAARPTRTAATPITLCRAAGRPDIDRDASSPRCAAKASAPMSITRRSICTVTTKVLATRRACVRLPKRPLRKS